MSLLGGSQRTPPGQKLHPGQTPPTCICLPVYLFVDLCVCLPVYLFVYLCICLFTCIFVCLPVYLFALITPLSIQSVQYR